MNKEKLNEKRSRLMIVEERKMTELGYALKEFRARNNITQQELAEIIGVSTNTIHLLGDKGL